MNLSGLMVAALLLASGMAVECVSGRAAADELDSWCAQVKQAPDVIICSDPELRQGVIARNRIFEAARASLGVNSSAYKTLLAEQNQWVKDYTLICGVGLDDPVPAIPVSLKVLECYRQFSRGRTAYLETRFTACDFPLDKTIAQVSEMRLVYAGGMLGLKWMPQPRIYADAEAKTIAARLQEQWRKNRDEYNRTLSRAIENLSRARSDPFGLGSRMVMRLEHGEPLREIPTDVDEAIHFLPAGKGDFEQLIVFAHAACALAIVSLTGLNAYPVPYSPSHYFARLE